MKFIKTPGGQHHRKQRQLNICHLKTSLEPHEFWIKWYLCFLIIYQIMCELIDRKGVKMALSRPTKVSPVVCLPSVSFGVVHRELWIYLIMALCP